MRGRGRAVAALALLAAIGATAMPAHAAGRNEGTAFVPGPVSEPRYAVGPTTRHTVRAGDGAALALDVTLPAGVDRPVPVILMATPYVLLDATDASGSFQRHAQMRDHFVPRGYAVAIGHVRGTGDSGGCWDLDSPAEIDATARQIEYLGGAPWSSGRVGMLGLSYDADVQLAVAAAGDRQRIRALKAIVPVAGFASEFDAITRDGAPVSAQGTIAGVTYAAVGLPGAPAERAGCPEVHRERSATDVTAGYSDFWRERDLRPHVGRIRAATLFAQGHQDVLVPVLHQTGLLDRFDPDTPVKMVLGAWDHAWPDVSPAIGASRAQKDLRTDWLDMVHAWFDRYLMGLRKTRVARWPRVQVEDSEDRWHVQRSWPYSGRPGQLALSAGGVLGAPQPSGSSGYVDAADIGSGTDLVFSTPRLEGPLHLSGLAVLDLWATLPAREVRILAWLQAFDAAGNALPAGTGWGARSTSFLDPMPNGYFEQPAPVGAPAGVPVRVPIRMGPLSVSVPAGGRLELHVGQNVASPASVLPSLSGGMVTLLHDCASPSVLRFFTPSSRSRMLNVREGDEPAAPLASAPARLGPGDGGGLAQAAVCDDAPSDPRRSIHGRP